ncbi:MAG TPA: cupin domain-containing protein [Archangium sp.]
MTLRKPALDPSTLPARTTSLYPEPFRSRVLPREKRGIGDALGLTKFGVNLTTLFPGKESSMRHHHTHEEEFVYVLEGEVVLRTDEGEQVLRAGDCAGFPAGSGNAHQVVNRGSAPARYLEVGTRDPADSAVYPDDDLAAVKEEGKWVFKRRDGTSY